MAYCTRCGTSMEDLERDGKVRPVCPSCGFVQYRDPKVAVGVVVGREGHVLMVQRNHHPRKLTHSVATIAQVMAFHCVSSISSTLWMPRPWANDFSSQPSVTVKLVSSPAAKTKAAERSRKAWPTNPAVKTASGRQ